MRLDREGRGQGQAGNVRVSDDRIKLELGLVPRQIPLRESWLGKLSDYEPGHLEWDISQFRIVEATRYSSLSGG